MNSNKLEFVLGEQKELNFLEIVEILNNQVKNVRLIPFPNNNHINLNHASLCYKGAHSIKYDQYVVYR